MARRFDALMRRLLLHARLYRLQQDHAADPYSPEYLYLVQQQKRLSLSASVGRLRPRYILLLPVTIVLILVKTVDLWIANEIIRSLINERDLLERSTRAQRAAE